MSHTRFKVNPHSIFFLNVAPVSSKAFLDIQTTIKCGLTLERVRDITGECRASETSKMEHFVIIINSFQPLAIIMDRSTLDVAAALDPPLGMIKTYSQMHRADKYLQHRSIIWPVSQNS